MPVALGLTLKALRCHVENLGPPWFGHGLATV